MRAEVLARGEVEEVLPRALGLAGAEALELGQEVGVLRALDPLDDLLLALARGAGEQVDDRVRVGGDEVDRAVVEALVGEGRAHRPPPAAGHARVADGAAAEHPHAQVEPALADVAHPLGEALAPGAAQARPVLLRAAERGGALGRRGRVGEALGRAQLHAQLVPLDLVGDERGDQVVEVGGGGEQHRERAVAVVEPAAAAGGRLERLPVLDRADAVALEDDRLLAHHDHLRVGDLVGQAAGGVEEGAEVEVLGGRQRVQARVHRAVARLQHAHERLARGAQQRRVRAVVELDLVGGQPGGLVLGRGDAETGDGHLLQPSRSCALGS